MHSRFYLCLLVFSHIVAIAVGADDAQRTKDALIVRTLMRLPGVDLESKPDAKAALLRHLETLRGTEQYLEIVEKFKLRSAVDELLKLAIEQTEGPLGVKAAGLLVKLGEQEVLAKAIGDPDPAVAAKMVKQWHGNCILL